MADSYLDLIPIPPPSSVNVALRPPGLANLRGIFGEPRNSYTGECQPVTGAILKRLLVTASVGPFRVTGVKLAVDSLRGILAGVKAELPHLYAVLGTAGMLCARKVKLPGGKLGKNPSNHSWGLAIDIKLKDALDKQGDNKCFRGLLILSRYFNAAGWYWGVAFPTEDAMHFEVSQSLLKKWRSDELV